MRTADEVLEELLTDIEELALLSNEVTLGEAGVVLRREMLSAAVTAKTRLEKVRLGVVAA